MLPIKFSFDADIIKCPVCADVFKSPRVLPCGHSVCLSCLSSLIVSTVSSTSKETFQCPSCHRTTRPRDPKQPRLKWAPQFPVNATIYSLLRNASVGGEKSSRKAFCELCLKNNMTKYAVAYCNTCFEHHCDICVHHHQIAEETRLHQVVTFSPTGERAVTTFPKQRITRIKVDRRKSVDVDELSNGSGRTTKSRITERKEGINEASSYPGNSGARNKTAPPLLVAQTITTTTQPNIGKTVIKLGHFNGASLTDTTTSEFRSMTFLSDTRVVLADSSNKKIKVFDISHKTRVEVMTEMVLRADPLLLCTIDSSTFAVVTERTGAYHIRLFTVRDKIQHFVQKIIEGTPVGLGYLNNTVICSTLQGMGLHKYRLSRSQQNRLSDIRHDSGGNELFHQPGVICSGPVNGQHTFYVADESEFGITVTAIDIRGTKMTSVFLECTEHKPKKPSGQKGAATLRGVLKSRRFNQLRLSQSLPMPKKDSLSDTTQSDSSTISKLSGTGKSGKAMNAFMNIVEQVRSLGSATSRPPDAISDTSGEDKRTVPMIIKIDRKLGKNGHTLGRSNKVTPKPLKSASKKNSADATGSSTSMTSPRTDSGNSSTKTPVKPRVYRVDSIAVDKDSYVYICMSKENKIHQLSPDGRIRRDMLSEADGIVSPRAVGFSPSNDVFLVTCANSNRVLMFRMK